MGEHLLDNIDEVLDNAPRFGLNAKQLLLQAAAAARQEEEEQENEAQAARAAAEQAALRSGSTYLEGVDPRERPQVAYQPRAKFARIIRQTVLNKLAGQHLALAALHAGGLPPMAVVEARDLRRAAFATALAQERELYVRCATGQVYQNVAARTHANQWAQPQYDVPPLDVPAPPAQRAQQAQRPLDDKASAGSGVGVWPGPCGGSKGGASGAQDPPAKGRRGGDGQLVECDLDWGSAVADNGEEDESSMDRQGKEGGKKERVKPPPKAQQRQQEEQQQQGRGQGGTEGGGGSTQAKPRSCPAPPPGPPPTVLAGPAPAEQLAAIRDPGGPKKKARASGYNPSEAAAAAVAGLEQGTEGVQGGRSDEVTESLTPFILPVLPPQQADEGPSAAPTPPSGSAQHAPAGGDCGPDGGSSRAASGDILASTTAAAGAQEGPGDASNAADAVEEEVLLFIRAELEPLVRRGRLLPDDADTVAAKCRSKVMARHVGAPSTAFLAWEGEGVRKLVAQYAEFYMGRQQEQQAQQRQSR